MDRVKKPQPSRQPQFGRQTVRIYPLPANIEPGDLAGGVAVVIDVLRASTTIIVALANGAARVIPCGLVDTARSLAAEDETGNTLTGGERGGVKIEGFDLDNSPASYTRERVAGRSIAFTTTNGTAALLRTQEAARVLIGALVNRQAIVDALRAEGRPIHLVCAARPRVWSRFWRTCPGLAPSRSGSRSVRWSTRRCEDSARNGRPILISFLRSACAICSRSAARPTTR